METQVTVIADHGATPAANPHADDAMLRSVQRVIRVEQVVALAILVVILGLFAIAFFGNPSIGAFIIGAIVAFLAFGICGLVAENFFFKPYRSIAFAVFRRRLNAELSALSPAMAHVWKAPLPGSIAILGWKAYGEKLGQWVHPPPGRTVGYSRSQGRADNHVAHDDQAFRQIYLWNRQIDFRGLHDGRKVAVDNQGGRRSHAGGPSEKRG